jgi:hypothetical protein
MSYEPKVNDYVKWNKGKVEGWVYFKGEEYVTIEVNVRPKNCENYEACCLHRNDRLLVLCYTQQWNELDYITSRESPYDNVVIANSRTDYTGMECKTSCD